MRWLPAIVVLILVACGGLLAASDIKEPDKRRWALLSLLYLAGLGMILFTPISIDVLSVYIVPAGTGRVNLSRLYLHGVGFFENIILTVPLGFMIKKIFSQMSILIVSLIGVIIGSAVEIMQYYLSQYWLINRISDINDVIANAIGIFIGGLIVIVYQKYKLK